MSITHKNTKSPRKPEPVIPNKNFNSEQQKSPQKIMIKLLGNLSERDYQRVWHGWAKNSNLGILNVFAEFN